MTPLPAVRDPAPPRTVAIRRMGPVGLAVGAVVATLAVIGATVVALFLAAAVALAALLALAAGALVYVAWRVRGSKRVSGWREARVGDAWVGYRWDSHGPQQG